MSDLALLAPVPQHHLASALKLPDTVLFGSNNYELFEKEELPQGMPVYFYASHGEGPPGSIVSYQGTYVGWTRAENLDPEGRTRRPESTASDSAWAGYYEVRGLHELPNQERFAISDLRKKDGGRLSDLFIPEGPILVST